MSLEGTLFASLVDGRTTVLTFCDAHPHDNLVAQLSSRNGARTITVQHGQYRVLTPVNMSADAEAYANFVSDRLLAWGEATCEEFQRYGISRARMYITGWIRPLRSEEHTSELQSLIHIS